MPFETIFHHRNTGDNTRNTLIRWNDPEAKILQELGIPTAYYLDSQAHGGLANIPGWLVSAMLMGDQRDIDLVIDWANKYPLDTPF